jgi:hypothetical protein
MSLIPYVKEAALRGEHFSLFLCDDRKLNGKGNHIVPLNKWIHGSYLPPKIRKMRDFSGNSISFAAVRYAYAKQAYGNYGLA